MNRRREGRDGILEMEELIAKGVIYGTIAVVIMLSFLSLAD